MPGIRVVGSGRAGDGLWVRLKDANGWVQSTTEATMIEAGGGVPLGESGVEPIAGMRDVDLSLETDAGTIDSSSRKWWIDPWIGARWRRAIVDDWDLELRGDIGGFGVGTDLAWQAIAALRVALGESWSIVGGDRALGLDFSDSDLEYDAILHGPVLGAAFR